MINGKTYRSKKKVHYDKKYQDNPSNNYDRNLYSRMNKAPEKKKRKGENESDSVVREAESKLKMIRTQNEKKAN